MVVVVGDEVVVFDVSHGIECGGDGLVIFSVCGVGSISKCL